MNRRKDHRKFDDRHMDTNVINKTCFRRPSILSPACISAHFGDTRIKASHDSDGIPLGIHHFHDSFIDTWHLIGTDYSNTERL
jgi:hypothetical protein